MTTPIPAVGYPGAGTRLQSDIQTYLNTMLAINMEMLGATGEAATATILSNTFTPGNDNCICPIDTNSLPSDTLNTIQSTNIRDGMIVYVRIVNNAHVITIANNATGPNQIYTADGNSIVLNSTKQFVALKYKASITAWEEIFRTLPSSAIIAAGNLSPLFTTSIASQTLNFTLTAAGAGTIFGNFSGSSGAPSYNSPGSADQVLGVAHTGGGLEYKTVASGTGIVITPTAGQISIAIATPVSIANGGTNATTASAAFNNLSPMTTLGDTIYGGTSGAGTRLAGNTTTTRQFHAQTGTGSASAAPVWTALAASDIPAVTLSASGNGGVTGTLPLANGGTGQVTTAAAYNALSPMTTLGDIEYESAANTAHRLAGNITATKNFLTQTGTGTVSAAPAWNTIAAADVPAITLSASGNGGVTGTLQIGNGGTNATSASAAFNNLSPVTTLGDLIYGSGTNANSRLAGNTSATKQFLTQTGTGSASAAPAWHAIAATDVPAITLSAGGNGGVTGTLPIANGGTNATTASAGFNNLSPITTTGDLIIGTGTNTAGRLGIGANNTLPISNGSTLAYGNIASANFGSNILAVANGGTGAATFNANTVFAGPTSGSAAAPSARALVNGDMPYVVSTAIDTGILRNAAGILEVDNGTAGDWGALNLGNLSALALATPAAPTSITHGGTAGSTNYSYAIAAVLADGTTTPAGPALQTTTGNATLSGTNTNIVNWSAVTGASSYNVYRTASSGSPASTGLIGNTTALSFTDTGITASTAAPSLNSTGVLTAPVINQIANTSILPLQANENQGPLANNPDFLGDWLLTGYTAPGLPTSALTCTFTGNSGITILTAKGNRIAIQDGDARLTHSYTASKDTYVDVDNTGAFTYVAVNNGAAAPAVTSNSMRLAKVVSGASTVTVVTILAQQTPPSKGQIVSQGRLYLVSGSPYADGSSSNNNTLFYGPDLRFGNQISLSLNSSALQLQNFTFNQTTGGFAGATTMSGLTSTSGHSIYVYWDQPSQTAMLDFAAWSGNTPPAYSTGTDGRSYKSGDFTRLLVGFIYAVSTTQTADYGQSSSTSGAVSKRFVQNLYNQLQKPIYGNLSSNATTTSTTFANLWTTAPVQWFDGIGAEAVPLNLSSLISASVNLGVGILGLCDINTTYYGGSESQTPNTGISTNASVTAAFVPTKGLQSANGRIAILTGSGTVSYLYVTTGAIPATYISGVFKC